MGLNVFVAGYLEFQLGTGSKPNVSESKIKNRDAEYEYGQAETKGVKPKGSASSFIFEEQSCPVAHALN